MDEINNYAKDLGVTAISELPDLIAAIHNTLDTEFKYSSLQSVEQKFGGLLPSGGGSATNDYLVGQNQQVRDHAVNVVNSLYAIQRYLYTLVPMIEDGGNFGVSIQ
ncbi:hypothetical protein SARC_11288, partial [Sphaeroforma arctica JP610]